MALSFPIDPQPGDTYVAPNGYTYTWDGTKWYVSSSGQTSGGSGPFTVKDEGNVVNTVTTILNFVGAAITATSTGSQVNITVTASPLTTATTATLGGVIIGSGVTITDGVISVDPGLTNWSESKLVVDAQTAKVILSAVGTQTNIDAVIKSQGLGAITNDSEGNQRGQYAVDWQRIRGAGAEVASGSYAVISGGSFNRATGLHSIVIGGNNNTNNSDYGIILGGANGNTRNIKGAVITPAYATGGASDSSGVIQSGVYLLGGETSTASQQSLTTDANPTLASTNALTLPDNSAYYFKGVVIGKEINGPLVASWTVEGVAYRQLGSTTTSFLYQSSAPVATKLTDTPSTTWDVILDIESSIGCILITVQGDNGRQIRWAAKIETLEVTDTGM
jgi:hypothetical protein